jgi:hypothetical protein
MSHQGWVPFLGCIELWIISSQETCVCVSEKQLDMTFPSQREGSENDTQAEYFGTLSTLN